MKYMISLSIDLKAEYIWYLYHPFQGGHKDYEDPT